MDQIAPTKQHQRVRFQRQNLRGQSPIKQFADAIIVHLTSDGVPQSFDILKTTARVGLLDQQCDGKEGIVEMPTKLLPRFA
jgi:hypothetical protein